LVPVHGRSCSLELMVSLLATAASGVPRSVALAGWWRSASQPVVLIGLFAAAALYGQGVRRLWRGASPGRGIARWRVIMYATGIATLALALLSPLDAMADDLFSAHMVQHLLLISIAAPLLVLGSPIVALLWALPRPWRQLIRQWWGSRPMTRLAVGVLSAPAAVWILHALALAFWHVPGPYDWAIAHEGVHALEHLSFLATACLFWWIVLPGPGGRRLGYGLGVLYVTAMAVVMGIYGAVLTFAPTPWYQAYADRTAAWGLTPLADQQLAGVIMWIPTSIVYLGAALWCFAEWLKVEERRHDMAHAAASRPREERGARPEETTTNRHSVHAAATPAPPDAG
jgi:putative membrane protein